MTDAEITRVIAEKVMGWTDPEYYEQWDGTTDYALWDSGVRAAKVPFFPLARDHDCMAAWDKFSKMGSVCLTTDTSPAGDFIWEAICNDGHVAHVDRRRAMCECMAKAMEDTQ